VVRKLITSSAIDNSIPLELKLLDVQEYNPNEVKK